MAVIGWDRVHGSPLQLSIGVGPGLGAGPTERLDGAAEAAGGGPACLNDIANRVVVVESRMMRREAVVIVDVVIRGGGRGREVGLGLGPTEGSSGCVVGSSRVLRRVEGAEPDPSLFPGVSNLGGESAPRPLPHAAEPDFLGRRGLGFGIA